RFDSEKSQFAVAQLVDAPSIRSNRAEDVALRASKIIAASLTLRNTGRVSASWQLMPTPGGEFSGVHASPRWSLASHRRKRDHPCWTPRWGPCQCRRRFRRWAAGKADSAFAAATSSSSRLIGGPHIFAVPKGDIVPSCYGLPLAYLGPPVHPIPVEVTRLLEATGDPDSPLLLPADASEEDASMPSDSQALASIADALSRGAELPARLPPGAHPAGAAAAAAHAAGQARYCRGQAEPSWPATCCPACSPGRGRLLKGPNWRHRDALVLRLARAWTVRSPALRHRSEAAIREVRRGLEQSANGGAQGAAQPQAFKTAGFDPAVAIVVAKFIAWQRRLDHAPGCCTSRPAGRPVVALLCRLSSRRRANESGESEALTPRGRGVGQADWRPCRRAEAQTMAGSNQTSHLKRRRSGRKGFARDTGVARSRVERVRSSSRSRCLILQTANQEAPSLPARFPGAMVRPTTTRSSVSPTRRTGVFLSFSQLCDLRPRNLDPLLSEQSCHYGPGRSGRLLCLGKVERHRAELCVAAYNDFSAGLAVVVAECRTTNTHTWTLIEHPTSALFRSGFQTRLTASGSRSGTLAAMSG
uniref:Ricin B-type lectin domain-containing protein n=1 Tax=Macrostomum lignano TaxID=282301 RepID=A0A1I8FLZ5_9PLAT